MSEEPKPKRRMTNYTYPERVPVYDTPEGKRLWILIAKRRQCSVAAAARQIIREEAERLEMPYEKDEGAE